MAHGDIKRQYAAGDEVVFEYAGLLTGRVERVTLTACKVRYQVIATFTFDVPESAIVGLEKKIVGEINETA